ncbi:MAG: hypothetical protein ABGW81_02820 [Paracoccaceae bacterium]
MHINTRVNKSLLSAAFALMKLLFHSIVRNVRKSSGNATMGLAAPLGGMTLHRPMNTAINTLASIIAGLYMQVLAFALILTVVHSLGGGLGIYDPMGTIFPIFMVWASGAAFVSHFPRHTSMEYRVYLSLTLIMIAMMVEFWLRKNMSQSWGKRSML